MTHLEAGRAPPIMLDGPAPPAQRPGQGLRQRPLHLAAARCYVFTVHALNTDTLGLDDDAAPAMASFMAPRAHHRARPVGRGLCCTLFLGARKYGTVAVVYRHVPGPCCYLKPLGTIYGRREASPVPADYHDLEHVMVHESG